MAVDEVFFPSCDIMLTS